jgi:hypothetical protein
MSRPSRPGDQVGTTHVTEARLAALRGDLAAASSTAERIAVLAAMIELAAEQGASGEAALARSLLGRVLADLAAMAADLEPAVGSPSAAASLPDGGDDYLVVLFLQAEASLQRDDDTGSRRDIDVGIDCLRRLREWLPADDPARVEVDATLARALMTRMGRAGGRPADIDEAGVLLASLLHLMDPDDPDRRRIISALAVQRAARYAGYDGSAADRDEALRYAAEAVQSQANGGHGPDGSSVAVDGDPDEPAIGGHLVIAWMTLIRQFTSAQRSAMLRRANLEAARPAVAPTLRSEQGTLEIAPADAETAIAHLCQIPAEAGELLAARAALLAAASAAEAGEAGLGPPVTDALSEAVTRLPAGHPVRTAQLGLLRQALGSQVTSARAADDPLARLEDIVATLDRMPNGDPESDSMVAAIGLLVMGAGASHRSVLTQRRLSAQLEQAVGRLAPDDPVRPFAQAMYWASVSLRAGLEHRRDLADSALVELMSLATSAPAGNQWRPWLFASVGYALIDLHGMSGEIRHLDQADEYVRLAFAAVDPAGPFAEGAPGHSALLFLRGHLAVLRQVYDRDQARLPEALADLERAAELIGPDHPSSSFMISTIQTARTLQARMQAPAAGMFVGPEETAAFDAMLAAAGQIGGDHPEYPLLLAQGANGLMLRGIAAYDRELIDRAIPALANACSVPGLANRERTRMLETHGFALLTRHVLTRSQRDLSNAIGRLEEARRTVEQEPGSPYAAGVLQRLASAYRTRGDRARGDVDRAAALGLAGLQELVGDVLLQDTDENALHRARQGTNEATEMARWLLERDRPAEAVSALEFGRGMVLHAASSGAGVETALRESGHASLADKWAGAVADDSDLRYQTMTALEQSPAQARLLSPPSAADIAAALSQAAADALVYLIPPDTGEHGYAVLVARDAAVRLLSLPGLEAGADSPVGDFLAARRSAEAAMTMSGKPAKAAAEAAARPFWLAALSALCDWAWPAVMRPVLGAARTGTGREPRIVLVPGGELGVVPWHAARCSGDLRYACQVAVISYAASARQFVDAARHAPRPWAEEPVLISDSGCSPDSGSALYITAVGIAGLQADYYPEAKVYGRARTRLDGSVPGAAATEAGHILAALPHRGYPGASLLHIGCHGQVEVPVLNSSLLLGAGKGGTEIRIKVRDILRQARRGRSAADLAAGGLVVLASCFSGVTETDYDEALTLTTAFLSAGAIGVVGASWMVGEVETAVFMALFHHFLNNSHPSPASALRETQLWMLDPARDVPGELPDAIRQEVASARESRVSPYASPEAWAGFSYQGR